MCSRESYLLFAVRFALQSPDLEPLLYLHSVDPMLSDSLCLSRLQVCSRFIHLDVSHGAGGGIRFDQGPETSVGPLLPSLVKPNRPMVKLVGSVFSFSSN